MSGDKPWRILTVCTGNVCRSPAAERLLARALGPRVEVSSAGIGALVDHPMDPAMAVLVEGAGVAAGDFRSRQITRRLIAGADLVLAMSEEHRSWLLREEPGALKHTFTLRRFAHLASEPDVAEAGAGAASVDDWLRAVVPWAFRRRSLGYPRGAGDEDIPDPYRRDDEAFGVAFRHIRAAVETVARASGGPGLG